LGKRFPAPLEKIARIRLCKIHDDMASNVNTLQWACEVADLEYQYNKNLTHEYAWMCHVTSRSSYKQGIKDIDTTFQSLLLVTDSRFTKQVKSETLVVTWTQFSSFCTCLWYANSFFCLYFRKVKKFYEMRNIWIIFTAVRKVPLAMV